MQKTEFDRKRPNLIQKKYKTRQNATELDKKKYRTRQNATKLFLEKFGRKKKRIEKNEKKRIEQSRTK